MRDVEFLVVGCGPAGGVAAREAARSGAEVLVLERDPVVGPKRVCAAGLRPGFCGDFDLPRSIVHCDTPVIALHSPTGRRYDFPVGPAHTTTREELDGTIAGARPGRGRRDPDRRALSDLTRDGDRTVVEFADLAAGERARCGRGRSFSRRALARGSRAATPFAYDAWSNGLITCYQYRVYLERPALPVTYETLEMHYYLSAASGRNVIAWMFPKRDHLSIGLGVTGKIDGKSLRAELDAFLPTVERRLFAGHRLHGARGGQSAVRRPPAADDRGGRRDARRHRRRPRRRDDRRGHP